MTARAPWREKFERLAGPPAPGWKRSVEVDGDAIVAQYLAAHVQGIRPKEFRFSIGLPTPGKGITMAGEEATVKAVVTWKTLGRSAVEEPKGEFVHKGELGVFGKLFDHAALKARAAMLCVEARAHGVAKHLLSVRASANKGSAESLLPARLFEDHVEGAARRVDAAKEALVKHFDDAVEARAKEHEADRARLTAAYAEKAAEAAASVASYKATAEQATAAMGKKVAEVNDALTQAREQLLVETASVGVAGRRIARLSAALKRANAKLRELRHGKAVRR